MPFGSGGGGVSLSGGSQIDNASPTQNGLTVVGAVGQVLSIFTVDNQTFGSFEVLSGGGLLSFTDDATVPALELFPQVRPNSGVGLVEINDPAFQTPGSGFNRDAVFFTRKHAAPDDADIASGELTLWFDQTNGVGNTKLMAKGKSADGTVKTAAIVLA